MNKLRIEISDSSGRLLAIAETYDQHKPVKAKGIARGKPTRITYHYRGFIGDTYPILEDDFLDMTYPGCEIEIIPDDRGFCKVS
jgi:hypothetical protein